MAVAKSSNPAVFFSCCMDRLPLLIRALTFICRKQKPHHSNTKKTTTDSYWSDTTAAQFQSTKLHTCKPFHYLLLSILVHALIEYKWIQTCSLIRHNKNSLIKLIITFSYQTIYMYIFQVNTLVLQLKEQKTVYKIKLTLLSRSSAAKTWLKSSRASFCWLHRK